MKENINKENANKWKPLFEAILGITWSMLALWGVVCFNQYVLMSLPLLTRMVLCIAMYLCIAIGPLLIMTLAQDTWKDYLFSQEKLGTQLAVGIGIGLVMSLVLTLPLFLTGHGEWSDNGKHYAFIWQYVYELVYCLVAVAFTEEFIFRGFLYRKLRVISGSDGMAILISSLAFGLFHIFGGSLVQVGMTSLIGLALCLVRHKVRSCTTLSLIIAHGLYDFLITVWVNVFL
ncbi:MAG: CPBP family intramembrane metalloprotease [bacterium]|nr:CPBP family intramembrane metalloprotease [bacterium]MCM1374793.1 CPBP family intramembrane metalloprotease [Muribaculum sp.]